MIRVRRQVTVQVLCGEDAAAAAARAATHKRRGDAWAWGEGDGDQAVWNCARALQALLDKEAETGAIGYLPPQMLGENTPQDVPISGFRYSRRAAEHGRREEYPEAIADLLRALLRANVDETARDKLMRTMVDFLRKAIPDNTEIDRAALKRTYRELSVKYHPDKNPESAELFGRIRDAYEILSDPVKMLLYDTGMAPGFSVAQVNHEISLEEAYKGGEKDTRSWVLRPGWVKVLSFAPRLAALSQVPAVSWGTASATGVDGSVGVPSDEKCTWDRQKLKLQIERGTMQGVSELLEKLGLRARRATHL
eukprot:Skav206575  [mRNA]  locus=scaffold925:728726:742809:- [translate_table: standard]